MNHREISSKQQLANYLRCSLAFLDNVTSLDYFILDKKDEASQDFTTDAVIVEKLHIKKKGKSPGFRIVHRAVNLQLSNTLKIFNNYLNEIFIPENCVHGFVSGKGIRTNAQEHLAKNIILSVDIANFFETITEEMVSEAFRKIGFDNNVSIWLSKLTTIEGKLVQGFNTSPTIGNIVVHEMDRELLNFCNGEIVYTRYADDLYFSTNDTLPSIGKIESIIERFGFKLNEQKTKIMKRGQSQFVTGLTVFDNLKPRIPKRTKRNIRLEIYFINKYGYKKHAIRRLSNSGDTHNTITEVFEIDQEIIEIYHRIFGWIHYIHSIEPDLGKKFYGQLSRNSRWEYSPRKRNMGKY